MFTGIVTDIGTIDRIEDRGDRRVHVKTAYDTADIALGASIACSGVCLTVVDKTADHVAFDVSSETLSRTAADMWSTGRRLNLERALRVGDELGGHIVTGHVDGVGKIVSTTQQGGSNVVVVAAGPEIAPYVAAKGSITVDGVSLTVNSVVDTTGGIQFGLNLIPHTSKVTTFGDLSQVQSVNLEIDVLARYLQRMEQLRATA